MNINQQRLKFGEIKRRINMKVFVEMTENEYQAFKDYRDNRTPYNELEANYKELLEKEERLKDIIHDMFPEYTLWITNAPTYYYLKKKEDKE